MLPIRKLVLSTLLVTSLAVTLTACGSKEEPMTQSQKLASETVNIMSDFLKEADKEGYLSYKYEFSSQGNNVGGTVIESANSGAKDALKYNSFTQRSTGDVVFEQVESSLGWESYWYNGQQAYNKEAFTQLAFPDIDSMWPEDSWYTVMDLPSLLENTEQQKSINSNQSSEIWNFESTVENGNTVVKADYHVINTWINEDYHINYTFTFDSKGNPLETTCNNGKTKGTYKITDYSLVDALPDKVSEVVSQKQ